MDYKGYIQNLKTNKLAKNYLIGRGFDLDFLSEFSLGSCDKHGDFFNGYITMPIIIDNEFKTMTSRSYNNTEPPHKHLPGSLNYFYNHQAILDYYFIIIVESPLCALSLLNVDIPAIAVMGSGRGRIPEIKDFDKEHEIIIIPDSDSNKAGIKGASKTGNLIHPLVKSVKIAELPLLGKKTDPNDLFRRYGPKRFKEIIDQVVGNAKEFIPYSNTEYKPRRNFSSKGDTWRDTVDIVEVIREYVDVEQIGSLYRCLCPFHADSNPSLVIYPNTNSFYCWGCGIGGSVADFRMNIASESFKEAVDYIKAYY